MSAAADLARSRRPTAAARRRGRRRPWSLLALGLALAFFVVPLLYLVSMSFMSRSEVLAGRYLPQRAQWDNWSAAAGAGVPSAVGHSVVVAAGAAVVTVLLAVPGAWAMARRGVGGRWLGPVLLAPWLLPPIVAVVPLFVLLRQVRLNNTLLGLALVYALANIPVAVYLLDGFIRQIPEEIEEAAALDGAGPVRLLARVVGPVLAPGLIAVGVIVAIVNYDEFLLASFIAQGPGVHTVPVAISLFQGDRFAHLGRMAAASLIGVLPVYSIAVVCQRLLTRGMTTGSVR